MKLMRRLQLVDNKIPADLSRAWLATAIKVAFASSDMKHVDQHFGAAQSFTLYALDKDRLCFLEAIEFGSLLMDGNEDKLAAKMNILEGCSAVYSQAIGSSAISQLTAKNIQPIKVLAASRIDEILKSLQQELKQGATGWLAKAIARTLPEDESRFDKMAQDGWQE